MNLTRDNPFRILGLPVTASVKDITKQVNTLATYAELGKTRSFETDFSFLPPINKTAEAIEEANKRIEQNENRLLFSLFWFWTNNSDDELAWDALKKGRVERAIEIWEKVIFANKDETYEPDHSYGDGIKVSSTNFSNIKNLSVLFLSLTAVDSGTLRQDYFRRGAALANKCFSDEYIKEYAKLVAGDRCVYDPAKALHFYVSNVVDSLRQYLDKPDDISTGQLIQTFSTYPIEAKQYIHTRFLAKPIQNIEKEIASAQAAKSSSPSSAVDVGKSLVEVTKSDIGFLKAALGKSDYQYQNIADKLADEVIQCGIDSFNLTQDDEPCLQLYQYGSSIAVSLRTQERAKENLDSCIGFIENKQAAQRRSEEKDQAARQKEERRKEQQRLEGVESRINVVLSSRASAKAKYHLLRNNVVPLLDSIEREDGGNSRPFTRASNSLSRVFRNLARELDQSKDFGLALEAIELASTICCDRELNATIEHESALISQNIHVIPIKNLCQRATATAADHPESADQSARWLVNNSRHLLSELKKVVSASSSPSDIHDQVVLAALSCHNLYGQATGDVEGCLEIVELILPLAASQSVRSKVVEQIDFAHWYLEQAKSSKTTGRSPAIEQYRLAQEGATGAKNPQARADGLHESESPEQTVPYKVRYSESDGVKTLTAQIASIVNAPEPPEQKFFSLLDSILPLVREISQVCGDRSAASRVASESAVNALRDISSELFRELPTRHLAYEALKLAADLCSDPSLKKDIERELVVLEEYAAEMGILIDALDDVARPPALKSLAGTGLVLAGASDYDSKGISHLSNLYLSLFFVRLIPLARYRVIKRKDGSVRFIGKSKLRRIDYLHILFVISIATALLLALFWRV